jgi:biotin carboxyl carrier protein
MGGKRTLHAIPDGEAFDVRVDRSHGGFRVHSDAPALEADVECGPGGPWSVLTDAGSFETQVHDDGDEIRVQVGGERFRFSRHAAGDDASGGAGKRVSARADIKAPMPGKVVKLLAAVGDEVTAGQGILLFEAMKMQNEIKSPQDGTLRELLVEEGQTVESRDRLFVIHRS